MGFTHKVLTLDMLEEGLVLADLRQGFIDAHRELARFAEQHGDEAKGAKATLAFTIGLKVSSPGNATDVGTIVVSTSMKRSAPSRPAVNTRAMIAEDDDGEMCLFARASGTRADDRLPDDTRQGVLATRDGRAIDQDTGEVRAEEKPETRANRRSRDRSDD